MGKSINPNEFRMPAEWEKQKGVWLQWPHEDRNYGYQRKLEAMWLEMTEILKQQTAVYICVQDATRMEHIDRQFRFYGIDGKNIEVSCYFDQ